MLETPLTALLDGSGLAIRPAPPELNHLLGCFWMLDGIPQTPIRTFPDGCAQVVVENGRCFLTGPKLQPALYMPPSGAAVMGVRLRPGAAHLLLRTPICDVVNRRVALDAPELTSIDAMQCFLRRRLVGRHVDAHVQSAVRIITESSGDAAVEDLAYACGIGRRQLERLMRIWVGLTPKRLSRIARFQAVIGQMRDAPPKDWIRMAAASYADQPHLIREFTEFSGASPKRLMRSRTPTAREARCG